MEIFRQPFVLHLEPLEDRAVPAILSFAPATDYAVSYTLYSVSVLAPSLAAPAVPPPSVQPTPLAAPAVPPPSPLAPPPPS